MSTDFKLSCLIETHEGSKIQDTFIKGVFLLNLQARLFQVCKVLRLKNVVCLLHSGPILMESIVRHILNSFPSVSGFKSQGSVLLKKKLNLHNFG